MRKIFFLSLLGYVFGIVTANIVCDVRIIIPFIGISVLITVLYLFRKVRCMWVFLCVFLVLGISVYHTKDREHIRKIEFINNNSSEICLEVVDNPVLSNGRISFVARAMYKKNDEAKIAVTIDADKDLSIRYGDLIFVKDMKVTLPDEGYNKGDMNYRMYLKAQGVSANMYTYAENVSFVDNYANPVIKFIYDLGDYTKKNLVNSVYGDLGGFSVALLSGDKSYISDNAMDNLEISGLSHIVAVSGLHLSILVMLVSMLFSRRRKRSYTAAVINIILCLFMVVFTGGSYSVIRAAIMVILVNIGYFFGRGTHSLNSCLCAGGMIVFANPFALFDMAFILSFTATISIILFEEKTENFLRNKLKITNQYINGILSVTISAQMLIIPWLIIMKNTVNTYSILSNLLVSPLIPLQMVVSVLMVVFPKIPFVSHVLKWIVAVLNGYTLKVADIISSLPYPEIVISDVLFYTAVLLCLIYCIIYICFYKNHKSIKFLNYIFLIVIAVCLAVNILYIPDVYIDFINVGQGDCTLIRDKGVNVLIDTGGSKNISSDFGNRVVGAYLKRKGVNTLDYVFITHFDTDHCQGVISLMDRFHIDKIVVPKYIDANDRELYEIIINKSLNKNIQVVYTSYGDEYVIRKDSLLKIVAPMTFSSGGSNSNSLMIMYTTQNVKTLFAGDNDKEEYIDYIDADADILKVGHHGAADSTSEEFLDKVSPYISVISVGEKNIYSHPHSSVLKMLCDREIKVFRTDSDGSVSMKLNNGKINVSTHR